MNEYQKRVLPPPFPLSDLQESTESESERAHWSDVAQARAMLIAGANRGKSGKSGKGPAPWPFPPGRAAYAGFAGRFVELVDGYTEADPVGVLVHLLAAFGCAVGRGPHAMVGATRHDPRLFLTILGKTAKSRKGESFMPIRAVLAIADPDFVSNRIQSGLASGEGLISAVRDGMGSVDPGVLDKRLMAIEPEFARLLTVMSRQGNTLSAVIRDGWDRGDLQTMTKTAPLKATGAHISIIGHITSEELRRELTDTDAANGFANRFIFVCVKRSKELPEPDPFQGPAVQRLADELGEQLGKARTVGLMERDTETRELWRSIYHELSSERDGLVGSILARAEAQVLRLSLIYALMDGSGLVRVGHLESALELWQYSERCVKYLFEDAMGDPVADRILRALVEHGPLTRTHLNSMFSGHISSGRVAKALEVLSDSGLARYTTHGTRGRPVEEWQAV